MAGVLGRLHKFDATLELWEQHVERLSFFGRNHKYRQKAFCTLISNWASTLQAPHEFMKHPETRREELQRASDTLN